MTYHERLSAPLGWWIGALCFSLTFGWLMYVAATPLIAALFAAAAMLVAGGLVAAYGSLRIAVDDELRAGRAHLEGRFIGAVEVLDPAAYRATMGPRADVRAWLVTRPWIVEGVKVVLDDASDPVPYWLLGSRHPDQLAAAVEALRQTGRQAATGGATPKGA
ncbi:MAG: DUF3093 domain-containing protein [Aeromicrobium sp.]|uniref:DUF3093 domain-containing protein n=1 Tax=Aeromicrobium sp. TaxID=1871063 RepID=UPI0039E5A03E